MTGFLIGFFTVILLLLCLFVVLIVLMQRPSANAGMGSSLGGGMAEGALGVESGNILTRWTIYCTVGFFILSFGLYLAAMAHRKTFITSNGGLPAVILPDTTAKEEFAPGQLTEVPVEVPTETHKE